MISKRALGFSMGVLILLLIIGLVWFVYTSQERAKAAILRHHVFCELIKPGMDLPEIRSILSQFGDYRENGIPDAVVIIFLDSGVFRQFGSRNIVLRFENGKYYNTYISPGPFDVSDSGRWLCR